VTARRRRGTGVAGARTRNDCRRWRLRPGSSGFPVGLVRHMPIPAGMCRAVSPRRAPGTTRCGLSVLQSRLTAHQPGRRSWPTRAGAPRVRGGPAARTPAGRPAPAKGRTDARSGRHRDAGRDDQEIGR